MPAVIIILVNVCVDTYIYKLLLGHAKNKVWAKVHKYLSAILFLIAVCLCIIPKRTGDNTTLLWAMWLLFIYMSVYIPKYVFLVFHFISLIPRLFHKKAVKAISFCGVALAALTFVMMWFGAINRNNISLDETTLYFNNLPDKFNGYKIVQISDLHTGTFGGDTAFVSRLVDKINSLEPDLIVFTGDLVNRRSEEVIPYLPQLSRLRAADGVFSVLGNHDYGDYYDWDSETEHNADVENLKRLESGIGWNMLNNSTVYISKENDSIALIGVENIGDPPFKVYGDLSAAYPDITDGKFKILLTHNPAHWDDAVEGKENANISLTLSGHTHAMQAELFGLSPARLRYRHWGGLYEDSFDHKLYVNIGAGTVGFPARVGATPEITLLTLKSK